MGAILDIGALPVKLQLSIRVVSRGTLTPNPGGPLCKRRAYSRRHLNKIRAEHRVSHADKVNQKRMMRYKRRNPSTKAAA